MITNKEFEKYLNKIGGLENGYSAWPNKYVHPVRYRLFQFCNWLKIHDRKNPFRDKIYERGFFSVGNGWLGLVRMCIEELIDAGWNKETCQVKEKFGGLRFYVNAASDEQFRIITKYEDLSYVTCEDCGKPGKERPGGWIRTLCNDCVKS